MKTIEEINNYNQKKEKWNIEFQGNLKTLNHNFIYGIDFWWNDEVEKYFINKETEEKFTTL